MSKRVASWKRRETAIIAGAVGGTDDSTSLRRCRRCIRVNIVWTLIVVVTVLRLSNPSSETELKQESVSSSSSSTPSLTMASVPIISLKEHQASLKYMGNKKTNTGWNVDTLCLQNKMNGIIVYAVGAGEDISWDIGMIEEYGATVVIIDPTEKAKRHVESVLRAKSYGNDPTRVQFFLEGLGHQNGEMKFALPANPDHVSMRAVQLADSSMTRTVSATVRTLKDFMTRLGHSYLDILKIDIEGAEYDVLETLIRDEFMPFTQLLVEYHDRFLKNVERSRHDRLLRSLQKAGFAELWTQNGGQERGYIKVSDMGYCVNGTKVERETRTKTTTSKKKA